MWHVAGGILGWIRMHLTAIWMIVDGWIVILVRAGAGTGGSNDR